MRVSIARAAECKIPPSPPVDLLGPARLSSLEFRIQRSNPIHRNHSKSLILQSNLGLLYLSRGARGQHRSKPASDRGDVARGITVEELARLPPKKHYLAEAM